MKTRSVFAEGYQGNSKGASRCYYTVIILRLDNNTLCKSSQWEKERWKLLNIRHIPASSPSLVLTNWIRNNINRMIIRGKDALQIIIARRDCIYHACNSCMGINCWLEKGRKGVARGCKATFRTASCLQFLYPAQFYISHCWVQKLT